MNWLNLLLNWNITKTGHKPVATNLNTVFLEISKISKSLMNNPRVVEKANPVVCSFAKGCCNNSIQKDLSKI